MARQTKTRVLFVPAYAPSQYEMASSRQRVYQFLPRMEALGISARVVVPPVSGLRRQVLYRLALLRRARTVDLVLIQKKLFESSFLRLLLKANRNVIFDLDDAVFVGNPGAPGLSPRLRELKQRLDFTLRSARQVVVCNRYLAEYAGSLNRQVAIVPTVVDTVKFAPRERPRNSERESVTIGWVGSGEQHLPHLEIVEQPLRIVSRELPLKMCLVGTMNSKGIRKLFGSMPFPVEYVDWIDPDDLPNAIAGFDIGIMPLVDDEWSRGKCAFKALLYMAMGVPAIVSPVGMNCQVIRHRENGAFAREQDEWVREIRDLAGRSDLRARLGAAGRETVRQEYSLDVAAPQLAGILHAVRNRAPGTN